MCQPCADATARPPRRPRSSLAPRPARRCPPHRRRRRRAERSCSLPRTVISYVAPRKRRRAVNPVHADGRHGSMRSPVVIGTDAEDPLRHRDVRPCRSPCEPRVLRLTEGRRLAARDRLRVHVGLGAVDIADRLTRRRVDAEVVIERALRIADDRRRDDHPRVRVAEDAAVLLVARRVRRDLAELGVVPLVRGAQQHDAVLGGELIGDRRERTRRSAILHADARHHAHALRLDEDLPLVAGRRADRRAEVVVRPHEPLTIPPVREQRTSRHRRRSVEQPVLMRDRRELTRREHE